jgi:hypothetical protein
MNHAQSVNAERQAARVLENLLREIPSLDLECLEREPRTGRDTGVDIVAEVRYAGRPIVLMVEVKTNGQPRIMRDAALQLKRHLGKRPEKLIPVVMAPYLSEQARLACREEGVGYADFLGNAHIVFDTVFIDRQVAARPEPERRALKSLFKPKSARILRNLLREPKHSWRVAELAEVARVSIGLVSTVGSALRERGWAEQNDQGLLLTDPNDLLDHWVEAYEPPKGDEVRRYTHLHGAVLMEKLRKLTGQEGRIALASFAAAEWLAPYVRQSTTHLYADDEGLRALERGLDLTPAARGANFIVRIPDESGVLDDAMPVSEGIVATSPVQTYLDLTQAGERGREGAEHLRAKLLDWNR